MGKTMPLAGPLKFTCRMCGTCCILPDDTVVYATRRDFRRIARYLKVGFDRFLELYTRTDEGYVVLKSGPRGACIMYDHGCRIYPVRPVQCRTFPFWSVNLKSRRAWNKAAQTCPGMNSGRLWSVKEIRKRRDDFSWNLLGAMRVKTRPDKRPV